MATVGSLIVSMAANVAPLLSGLRLAEGSLDKFGTSLARLEKQLTQLASRTLMAGQSFKALSAGAGGLESTLTTFRGFPPVLERADRGFVQVGLGAQTTQSRIMQLGMGVGETGSRFHQLGLDIQRTLPPAFQAAEQSMLHMGRSSIWAGGATAHLAQITQATAHNVSMLPPAANASAASFAVFSNNATAAATRSQHMSSAIGMLAGGGGFGGLPPVINAASGGMFNFGDAARNAFSGITAPISAFTSALGGIAAPLKAAALGFTGFFAAVAAWRAMSSIVHGVGQAIQFVADSAIGMNARLEQAEISFTTLLGSGNKARSMLDDLADFARSTPFTFPEVVTGTQRLLAMGFAAQDAIPMMTALGNVTAGLGRGNEVIGRLVLALGQIQAAGRVLGTELRQLYEAGVNIGQVFEVMSDQSGHTVEELRRMQSEGVLSAELFIAAFREWSELNFGGLMERQTQTFTGAISVIKDSVQIVAAEGFKPLFDLLRDGLVQVANFMRSPEFDAWGTRLAANLQPAADAFRNFLSENQEGIKAFATGVLDISAAIGEVAVAVAKVDLQFFIDQLWAIKALSPLVVTIKVVVEDTLGTYAWLIGLQEQMDKTSESSDATTRSFGQYTDMVRSTFDPIHRMRTQQEGLSQVYNDTRTVLSQNKDGINEWVGAVGGADAQSRQYRESLQSIDEEYMIQNRGLIILQEKMANHVNLSGQLEARSKSFTEQIMRENLEAQKQADYAQNVSEQFRDQLGVLLALNGGYGDLDAMLAEINEGREEDLVQLQDLYDMQLLEQNAIHGISESAGNAAVRMAELRSRQAEVTETTGAFVEEGRRGVQMAEDLGVAVGEIGRELDRIDLGPLLSDMEGLSGAFQVSISMGEIFVDQGKQYDDINEMLKGGYDAINDQLERGEPLNEAQLRFLELYPQRSARAVGGMEDAAETAGMWAGAAVDLMIAQDELNEAIKNNEQDLGPYRDAVANAEQSLRDAGDASGGMMSTNQILVDVLLTQLVPALQDIEEILGRLDDIEASPSVTLNELVQSPSGGMGFTEFDGGATYSGVTSTVGGMIGAMNTLDKTTANPTVTLNDLASADLANILQTLRTINGSTFTANVTVDTSSVKPAVDAATTYIGNNVLTQSPTKEGPLSVWPDWDYLFEGIEASAHKYTEATLKHLKNYVDTAKSIFDVLSQEIEFSLQFAEFQAGGGKMPDPAMLEPLKHFTESVVQSIGDSAALFSEDFLKKTKEYADAAKTGLDLLSQAVELFDALMDMDHNLGKATHAASDLKFLTESIVLFIGDSAAMIERGEGIDHPSVRGEGFAGAAGVYAEHAKKAVELIGAAAEALAEIDKFNVNMASALRAITDLKFLIEHIVLSIGDSAAIVSSGEGVNHPSVRGEGFTGAAAEFAEHAQKAVALIADALSFITALAEYKGKFDLGKALQFASDLKFLTEHIVNSVGDSAALWDTSMTPAVEDFAKAAAASLSVMSDAAELLELFSSEMDFSNLTVERVRDRALALGGLARIVAEALKIVAAGFEDVEDSLGTFADAVGSSLSIMSDAADMLEILSGDLDFSEITVQSVRDTALSLGGLARIVAEGMKLAAAGFEDTEKSLETFADAVGNSFSVISDAHDALEIFTSQLDFSTLTVEQVRNTALALGGMARIVAEAFKEVAADWPEIVDPAVNQLADDISTSLGAIGDIFDFLQNFRPEEDSEGNIIPIITSMSNLRGVARQLAEAARIVAEEFYEVAKDWDVTKNQAILDASEAISAAIGAVSEILGLIKEIQDITEGKAPPKGAAVDVNPYASVVGGLGHRDNGRKGLDTSGIEAIIEQIIRLGVSIAEQVAPIGDSVKKITGSLVSMNTEGTAAVQNLSDNTIAIMEAWVESAVDLGEDYINGLVEGLRNREGYLYAVIAEIVQKAIAAAKAAAGAQSPSVLTMQLGHDILDGLAIGLQDDSNVQNALGATLGGMQSQLESFRLYYDSWTDEFGGFDPAELAKDPRLQRYVEQQALREADVPGLRAWGGGGGGAGDGTPILNLNATIDGRDVAAAIEPRLTRGMPAGMVQNG